MAVDFKDFIQKAPGATRFGNIKPKAAQTAEEFEDETAHPWSVWVLLILGGLLVLGSLGQAVAGMFNDVPANIGRDPSYFVMAAALFGVGYLIALGGLWFYRRFALVLLGVLFAIEWAALLVPPGTGGFVGALPYLLEQHPFVTSLWPTSAGESRLFGLQFDSMKYVAVAVEEALVLGLVIFNWRRFARAGDV